MYALDAEELPTLTASPKASPRRTRLVAIVTSLGISIAGAIALPMSAAAAEFTVTNDADSGEGTLRQAIEDANASPGRDIITFDPAVTRIELASPLEITASLTIEGHGAETLTISRATTEPFDQFVIYTEDVDLEIRNLAITGIQDGYGRGILFDRGGGLTLAGVAISGQTADWGAAVSIDDGFGDTLTISDSTFENNISEGGGGAVHAWAIDAVTLTDSSFVDNQSVEWGGGAVYIETAGQLVVEGSEFTGNRSHEETGWGGAIYMADLNAYVNHYAQRYAGDSTIAASSFIGNTGSVGGAVYIGYMDGTNIISGSTFRNNEATFLDGGAVYIGEIVTDSFIESTTFENNTANDARAVGGGLALSYIGQYATNLITDSSFIGNSAGHQGGGLSLLNLDANTVIERSTFHNNSLTTEPDGGLSLSAYGSGPLEVINSTFDEPSGSFQYAIRMEVADGPLTVAHSTFVAGGAIAADGAGVSVSHSVIDSLGEPAFESEFRVDLSWSALTDNPGPGEVHNIIGNQFGLADAGLDALVDNGGPTLTRLPIYGGPLVDTGNPDFTPPPATDQRGIPFERVFGAAIDIGATEWQVIGPAVADHSTLTVTPTGPIPADGTTTYTATVTARDVNNHPTAGTIIGFTIPPEVAASATECITVDDGTCSITLTATTTGTFTLNASIDTEPVQHSPATLTFTAGPASTTTSTISAIPATITADGTDQAHLTVTLRDSNNNPITIGGDAITINTNHGTLSPVIDHHNGTYTATLTGTQPGTATITFTINTQPATDTTTVTLAPNTGGGGNHDGGNDGNATNHIPTTGLNATTITTTAALLLLLGTTTLLLTRTRTRTRHN